MVRERGKLRWEKKNEEMCGVREILRLGKKKKKGIDMDEREEIDEKKIAQISQIFPLLNYSPLLQQYSSMWNKRLPIAITYLNVK